MHSYTAEVLTSLYKRFAISTELVASLLFTAFLKDNEAVFMRGAETYSKYSGNRV